MLSAQNPAQGSLPGVLEKQSSFNGLKKPKPFLKWAGGKTQLILEIEKRLPETIKANKFTYVEPFIGSGALLFWMLNNFPNMEKAVINDVNADLINAYQTIKQTPGELIEILKQLQAEFHALQSNDKKRKAYYYEKREQYNARNSESKVQAALFIFLN